VQLRKGCSSLRFELFIFWDCGTSLEGMFGKCRFGYTLYDGISDYNRRRYSLKVLHSSQSQLRRMSQ